MGLWILFLGFCLGSGFVDPGGCGQFRWLESSAEAFRVGRVRLGECDGPLFGTRSAVPKWTPAGVCKPIAEWRCSWL